MGKEYQKGLCLVSDYSENLKDIEERMRQNRVDMFANFGSENEHNLSHNLMMERRFEDQILGNAHAGYGLGELRPILDLSLIHI